MTDVNIKLPEARSNPWKDTMHMFNGSWMPDVDGALVGGASLKAEDFARIANFEAIA